MDILVLSQTQVEALLPMPDCMEAVAGALRALSAGNARLPLRTIVPLPDGRGVFGAMPAFVGEPATLGIKVITVFPGNEGSRLDSHQGAVLLFDPGDGRLLAVLDASSITAIRTAAASGVATRALAREGPADLALLGAGVQALTHLEAMRVARPLARIRVWSRHAERAHGFAQIARERLGETVEPVERAEDAVRGASLVCTVTSSREPVLRGEWLAPGAHVNAVGASQRTARELDAEAVRRARLFVDRRESALAEAGDFLQARDEGVVGDDHIVAELGEVLLGGNPGRRSPEEITLFKSVGVAVEDLAAARLVYARAIAGGTGTRLELGGERLAADAPAARTPRIHHHRTFHGGSMPAGVRELSAPTIDEVRDAARRLRGVALRTPLVRLHLPSGTPEVWLKLENLQPIGSFKLRGAGNAMLSAPRDLLRRGVYTASAGNMAQGVAWLAREFGVPCTVVVPDHAPQTKLAAIERLGGRVVKVPFDRWWQVLVEHEYPGIEGVFVHPVSDAAVMAGNGTVALEILEDLPDADVILAPYGGGGLSVGIAAATRALRPEARVYACEVETAAPLRASLAEGRAVACEYVASFVDGIGGKSVLDEMWPLASTLLAGALTVSLEEVAAAIRLLVERAHVVAEGAGAASVAAALKGVADARRVVCVVSGGNIDPAKLARILVGELP